MFFELDDFPFLKKILDSREFIRSELFDSMEAGKQASPMAHALGFWADGETDQDLLAPPSPIVDEWVRKGGFHPDQIGYDSRGGRWATLPLLSSDKPELHGVSKKYFPLTTSLVADIPSLNFCSFFRLAPGAEVLEHKHRDRNLIFHLVLDDLDGDDCMICCAGQARRTSRRGDWALFDYSQPHSSFNRTTRSRVNIIVDFAPDPQVLERHDRIVAKSAGVTQ